MNKIVIFISVVLITIISTFSAYSQSMSKKYTTLKTEIKVNAPAEEVWEALVGDYGAMSNWSPYIYSSNYENGSLKGVKGAERKCEMNSKGTMWLHEKIGEINSMGNTMEMRNTIIDGAKVPLNHDNTQAYYRVRDNGDGTSTASIEIQYRANPGIMTGMMKGSFKKSLAGNLIGLKHYVETGERVTPMNDKYKEIKHRYKEFVVAT